MKWCKICQPQHSNINRSLAKPIGMVHLHLLCYLVDKSIDLDPALIDYLTYRISLNPALTALLVPPSLLYSTNLYS